MGEVDNKVVQFVKLTDNDRIEKGKELIDSGSYLRAISSLLPILDNGDKKADTWIFPILCLFSQGYELYLKAIRSILYHLNGKNNSSVKKGNHNVNSIKNEIFNMLTVKT